MKKLLASLFLFGFLFLGIQQVHASVISDALLQIQNLKNEILQLKSSLKASVLDSSIGVTATIDLTPRISYYSGKVNQHVDIVSSTWQTDPDGSSGAGIDKLTYCKKFYPSTISVSDYKTETINSWHDGGNLNNYVSTRMSYQCVQPTVVNPVCSVNFSVTPTTITAGDPVTLNWSTENCGSLSIASVGPVYSASGTKIVYPSYTSGYALIAMATDGRSAVTSPSATVTVNQKITNTCANGATNYPTCTVAPIDATACKIINFSVTPSVIMEGDPVTLKYETLNCGVSSADSHIVSNPSNITTGIGLPTSNIYKTRAVDDYGSMLLYPTLDTSYWLNAWKDTTYANKVTSSSITIKVNSKSVTPIPINGAWSAWTNYGSCVNNLQTQTRSCTNPAPSNGGASCSGISNQQISCNSSVVPSVTILYPNGGQTFQAGQSVTVTWNSNNIPASQDMSIQFGHLYFTAKNTGSYTLTIPKNFPGDYYKFTINMGKEGVGEDTSDGNILVKNMFSSCFAFSPSLSVYYDSANLSSQISLNSKNVDLAHYKLVSSEKCSLSLDYFTFADIGNTNAISNVRLYDENGVLLSIGTQTAQSSNSFDFNLDSPLVINKGQSKNVIIKADIGSSYLNSRFQAALTPSSWSGKISGVTDNESNTALSDYNISVDHFLSPVRTLSNQPTPDVSKVSPCAPYGDVDNDGYLTSKDTDLMMKKIGGIQGFTYDQSKRADVNNDGVVSSMDITWIKNVMSGASSVFPVCTNTAIDTTPRISVWQGKVNQYVDGSGIWQSDADGTSGAEIDKLTYCNKFYSGTTRVENYKLETINTWHDKGNLNSYTSTRMSYKCVGADLPTPLINILSPKAGDVYKAGQTIQISWTSGNPGLSYVNFYKSDSTYSTPARVKVNPDTSGSMTYTFPKDMPAGQYKIYAFNEQTINGSISSTRLFESNGYITIISDNIDDGCSNGETYSSTTNQLCPVNSDILIYPKPNSTFKTGQIVNIVWDKTKVSNSGLTYSSNTCISCFTGIIIKSNNSIVRQLNNVENDGNETIKIPSFAPTGKYDVYLYWNNYSMVNNANGEKLIGTFYVTSNIYGGGNTCTSNENICPNGNTLVSNCVLPPTNSSGQSCSDSTSNGNSTSILSSISRTLALVIPRMMGNDVKLIQQFLGSTADGVYGRGTAYAVSGWQAEHGLVSDGTVGPNTLQKMMEIGK